MKIVGLTGGIASGKSTVSDMLRKQGIPIIDADLVARDVVKPGKKAWKKIQDAFGKDILSDNGEVDREKLGRIVFQDPTARIKLNKATHPYISIEILKQLIRYFFKGTPLVVLDAALLLETRTKYMVHSVIVVYADRNTQLHRLMARDGYSLEDADRRIEAQMPLGEKCLLADFVIDNRSSLDYTERQVARVMEVLSPTLKHRHG